VDRLGIGDAWTPDWLYGLLLIVLCVVIHAIALGAVAVGLRRGFLGRNPPHMLQQVVLFVVVVALTSTVLALLHGLEASLWALALIWLGAVDDFRNAIYFSLQMTTTLGADVVSLRDRWKLMGPLEGISGMLLFGLSTAFLFAVLLRAFPANIVAQSDASKNEGH
jgi:hypothetical protein